MAIFAYGFGCYLDDLHIRTDEGWRNKFKEAFPASIREEYDDLWEANKSEYEDDEESFFDDFVFEDINSFGYGGIEGLLARMINEGEFDGKEVMTGQELCLYATPRFPEYEHERDKMPLWRDLLEIIDKYIHLVYEDPDDPHIGYQYFHEL